MQLSHSNVEPDVAVAAALELPAVVVPASELLTPFEPDERSLERLVDEVAVPGPLAVRSGRQAVRLRAATASAVRPTKTAGLAGSARKLRR